MVRPWRPKRSRRNAQRAPGRTGPDCVMRGPLLVLGWPELSELEGCLGCRALAEHGLRSCRQTRLGGYASARRRLRRAGCQLPTGQGRGHVTCWTELVRIRRGAARFRRVPTERRTGGTSRIGLYAARRLHAAVALGALMRFVFVGSWSQRWFGRCTPSRRVVLGRSSALAVGFGVGLCRNRVRCTEYRVSSSTVRHPRWGAGPSGTPSGCRTVCGCRTVWHPGLTGCWI